MNMCSLQYVYHLNYYTLLGNSIYKKTILKARLLYLTKVQINMFHEYDKRGIEFPTFTKKTAHEHFRDGRKIFVEECKLFLSEVKEKLRQDRKLYQDGDTDVFFRFDSQDCLKKWRVSSDKTNKQGYSECSLIINDNNKAVFSGVIDTTPPKDGKVNFAGYCAIRSVNKKKSFLRDDSYDWAPFTHLELRVKGDGRSYAVNIGLNMYFDVTWFDMFSYVMFTRGGPYWETIRIPFSKFFLASKGRIQDKQCPIPLSKVNCVGITAAKYNGPFHLEIDYIGCHVNYAHTEKSAYELYHMPKEIVSD